MRRCDLCEYFERLRVERREQIGLTGANLVGPIGVSDQRAPHGDEIEIATIEHFKQALDPHGMDPETVLRFVKYVGGWPGRVLVVACEPEQIEDFGVGLSDAVGGAVQRAAEVVITTVAQLQSDAPAAHA